MVGNSPTGGIWEDITIWGTKAVVYLRRGEVFYKTQHSNEVYEVNNFARLDDSQTRIFIDAILGRDQVQVPPECGLRVIELTEAAWASAASGQPVKSKKHLTWFCGVCHIKRKSSSGATSSCYRHAEARGYASGPTRLCNWPQRRAELEYGL